LDEPKTEEEAMTAKKKAAPVKMTMDEFLAATGPGEPLEVLRARQEEDAKWAVRAFAGMEPLEPPIRIQRGRPKSGEDAPETVVKAVRLPVHLLERLQAKAQAQGLSLNALLQLAAAEYLAHHRGA
jgi:hypothetical protein